MATKKYSIQFIMETFMGSSIAQIAGLASTLLTLKKVLIDSTKKAIEFNEGMANVATLIPGEINRINELKDSIRDLSTESAKSLSDLSGGLYQVISAFGDATDTTAKMDVVTRASIAGLSTTTGSLNLLSAVTKAYGDTSAEALQKVSDLAFMTVKLGQTTFPELAGSIQGVTSLSKNLGVTTTELFTSFATLTGVTGNTNEVATQLKGALVALSAPSQALQKFYDQMGVSSGKAFVQAKGFQGALEEIATYSKESGISLKQLFGRIQAVVGAQALAMDQADTYKRKMDLLSDSVGATDRAYREQTEGINKVGFEFKRLGSQMQAISTEIGDAIIGAFGGIVPATTTFIDKMMGSYSITEQMNGTLLDLVSSTEDYSAIIKTLSDKQEGLTTTERNLLDIRKQQIVLDMNSDLLELAQNYDTIESKTQSYSETIETQTARQEKANAVIDGFKAEGIIDDLNNLTRAQMMQGYGFTELGTKKVAYSEAQSLLIHSTNKLLEAEGKLGSLKLGQQATMIKTAQLVANEQMSIEYLADAYPELYKEINTLAETMKKGDDAFSKGANEADLLAKKVANTMLVYSQLSSADLESTIKVLNKQKASTAELSEQTFLTALLLSLGEQLVVTTNEEISQGEAFVKERKGLLENNLRLLSAGKGLVKIENDRANAILKAGEAHATDADYLDKLGNYYDALRDKTIKEAGELAKNNLLLQTTTSEYAKIDNARAVALKKLEETGVTEEGIIADTNALYDDQIIKLGDANRKTASRNLLLETTTNVYDKIKIKRDEAIAQLEEKGETEEGIMADTLALYDEKIKKIDEVIQKEWEQKLFAISGASQIEVLEHNKQQALEASIKLYGKESKDYAYTLAYHNQLIKDYKLERSALEPIAEALKSAMGDTAYGVLENFQKGVKKLSNTWSDLQPVINAVSNAFSASFDLAMAQEEQAIELAQREIDRVGGLADAKDEALDRLSEANEEELNSLQEMYDTDQISYEEYLASKTASEAKYADDQELAQAKWEEAQNEVTRRQHVADVAQFENDKKSSISSAIIAGAEGIMQAWALGPIIGAISTPIIAGATIAQVASISAQPPPLPPVYLAEGGIATRPTNAVVGDGGEPEIIAPLSKAKDFGFGNGSDSPTYNISNNTFVGIEGVDSLLISMEERKKVLISRGRM